MPLFVAGVLQALAAVTAARLGQLSDASGDLAQRLLSTPSSPTLPGAAATGGVGLRAAAGGSVGGTLV